MRSSSLQVIATIIPPLDWLQAYHTINRSTSVGVRHVCAQASTSVNVHESGRPAQEAEGLSSWTETWISAALTLRLRRRYPALREKGGSHSPPNSMISAGRDSGHEVNDAGSDCLSVPRPGF